MTVNAQYYIGLMSGTSMDGIDIAAVDVSGQACKVIASHYRPYPADLKTALQSLIHTSDNTGLDTLGELDTRLGHFYADAVKEFLAQTTLAPASIIAIGSHGQTVIHRPPDLQRTTAYTLQIGDPNIIAYKTGITTVADFRRRDLAAGGQGAPLTPAFHAAFFKNNQENRIALNIGGIANITILPGNGPIRGFDTGPGNTLLDYWVKQHTQTDYDDGGKIAASGRVITEVLARMLGDPYFDASPPKSTGREYFNPTWLEPHLSNIDAPPADVLATLLELTAITITDAIRKHAPDTNRVYVCGGGLHNATLIKRIAALLPECTIESSQAAGINPDYVEACAFAWLAKQTIEHKSGNIPEVTGAEKPVILGGIFLGQNLST
jgi:anhydro-N-acetylmuramic acid kinase